MRKAFNLRNIIVGIGFGLVLSALNVHVVERPVAFLLACLACNGLADLNRTMK